jgi:hypothetical protein
VVGAGCPRSPRLYVLQGKSVRERLTLRRPLCIVAGRSEIQPDTPSSHIHWDHRDPHSFAPPTPSSGATILLSTHTLIPSSGFYHPHTHLPMARSFYVTGPLCLVLPYVWPRWCVRLRLRLTFARLVSRTQGTHTKRPCASWDRNSLGSTLTQVLCARPGHSRLLALLIFLLHFGFPIYVTLPVLSFFSFLSEALFTAVLRSMFVLSDSYCATGRYSLSLALGAL